jgi:luciferase family oxidoreductase group 1
MRSADHDTKNEISMTALSILDLALLNEDSNPREALQRSLELALHAEKWGYRRFWLAEHHNHDVIASSATSVVIGYIAAGTSTIRVGSGGIMLPNHAPLVIAEQFGTLEALYPGRIDLGLGRAPGGNDATEQALRRIGGRDTFPEDVVELQALLGPATPGQKVRATPGTGSRVPCWILGSTLNGAQLAARLGLPFAFAAHFRPDNLLPALAAYRDGFTPSADLQKPYAMVSTHVIAADSDEEAQWLASTLRQFAIIPVRRIAGFIAPPRADVGNDWSAAEQEQVDAFLTRAIIGGRETVRRGLQALIAETGIDEMMAFSVIHDQSARLRSYEILSEVAGAGQREPAPH